MFRFTFPDNALVGLSGLAVHNARLIASLPKMNQLLWVDASKRKILGTVELNDPRGVAFDPHGRLLALSVYSMTCQLIAWAPTCTGSSMEKSRSSLKRFAAPSFSRTRAESVKPV